MKTRMRKPIGRVVDPGTPTIDSAPLTPSSFVPTHAPEVAMTVGAADEAAERAADQVAGAALAHLRRHDTAGCSPAARPLDLSRFAQAAPYGSGSAAVGKAGGPLD